MPVKRSYGSDISEIPFPTVAETVGKVYALLRMNPGEWFLVDELSKQVGAPFQAMNYAIERLSMLPRIETKVENTIRYVRFKPLLFGKEEKTAESKPGIGLRL